MFYFEFWIYFQYSCLSKHMRKVASAFHCSSCCSYKIQFGSISAWFRSKFLCSTCVCLCLIVTYSCSLVFFTCSLVLYVFSLVFCLHSSCSLVFTRVRFCFPVFICVLTRALFKYRFQKAEIGCLLVDILENLNKKRRRQKIWVQNWFQIFQIRLHKSIIPQRFTNIIPQSQLFTTPLSIWKCQ